MYFYCDTVIIKSSIYFPVFPTLILTLSCALSCSFIFSQGHGPKKAENKSSKKGSWLIGGDNLLQKLYQTMEKYREVRENEEKGGTRVVMHVHILLLLTHMVMLAHLPPPPLSGVLCSPPPASTGGHCLSSPWHNRPRPAHQLRPHGWSGRLPYHVTRETLGVLLPPQGQVFYHGDAL